MQVRVHQLVHHVHVIEVGYGGRRGNVDDADDVFVMEMAKKLYFAQRALGVNCVFKRVGDFFNGDL